MSDFDAKATINFPADAAVKLMATKEYAEAVSFVDGAIAATARVEKADGKNVVIVVERTDPSRAPGAKGKTEKSTVTQEWDIQARKYKWNTHVHGFGKLVKINGVTWVEPDGDGRCRICEKGSVNINVALIGGMIAKGLANDLRKSLSKKAALVEKKLKEKQ